MAKISLLGQGNLSQIAQSLTNGIESSGLSTTLVDSVQQSYDNCQLIVLVFEKYYMRVSNRASLTVVLTSQNNSIRADLIATGGGQGAIFRFSWGAEENFAASAARILRRYGFN